MLFVEENVLRRQLRLVKAYCAQAGLIASFVGDFCADYWPYAFGIFFGLLI